VRQPYTERLRPASLGTPCNGMLRRVGDSCSTAAPPGLAAAILQRSMCMQCMAGAMTAGAAATGTRAYVAARRPSWLTSLRLKRLTVCLLVAAGIGAGVAASHQPADAGQTPTPAGESR
jgi:hypothetical protein